MQRTSNYGRPAINREYCNAAAGIDLPYCNVATFLGDSSGSDFFGDKPKHKGFRLVKSSGSTPRPIVDRNGKVSGGDLYGGGQLQPGALVNGIINSAIFAALIALPAFQRLAGFATGLFANWAPNIFDFYIDYMSIFYKKYDPLSCPFQNSLWYACTFNLGLRTCTLGHQDFANLVFGWCSITALGNFDFTRGGHLILWDCKLALEFSPGATTLIPSTAIFHSNIPIAAGERRYSFTQYIAGGLFHWVEHGFQKEEEFFETLTDAQAKQEERLGLKRASAGSASFSTFEERKAGL
ncbi:hypothetical protein K438DRAFT_1764884 [Mycena galopus ATCC 62051]|nr:hypothetical protein K438DRAFT_1764884 [Mycena galopus ATCC 62051]